MEKRIQLVLIAKIPPHLVSAGNSIIGESDVLMYLTSCRVLQAQHQLAVAAFPARSASPSDLERSWLVTWNLLGEDDIIYTLFYAIGDQEVYEQHIADAEVTVDYDITPVDENSFYAYVQEREKQTFQRFRTAFEQPSVVVAPPLAYRPDGRVDFDVVGEPEDLAGIPDSLPDEITVEVSEVGEYDARPGVPVDDLTTRQREALRAAVEVGYYEYPRTGSVKDVAEILDCATSTASNHLQKAEARLISHFIGN